MKNSTTFVKLITAAVIIVFGVWRFCYPVSTAVANKHFDSYMEEYNIPPEDIAGRKTKKAYMGRPVVIEVEYKSDPEYRYDYHYEMGDFSDNRPCYVIVYGGEHKNISIGQENLYNVKYPPVTQKEDFRK